MCRSNVQYGFKDKGIFGISNMVFLHVYTWWMMYRNW